MTFSHVKVLRLRSDVIDRAFLLFPTITEIADTPNGKKLSVRGTFTLTSVLAIEIRFHTTVALSYPVS